MNRVWSYDKGLYKVYTEDLEIKKKLDKWKDFKLSCYYNSPTEKDAWDYVFPKRHLGRIKELLNITEKDIEL